MKNFCKNIKRDQEGVTTVFAAIMLSSFMILAGLGVDLGLVYYAKHRLAENARLASLAGASVLNPTIGSSTYRATAQSVLDNNIGLVKIMTIKSTTISADCLQTVKTLATISTNAIGCLGSDLANAVTVTQTATVPFYFMRSIMSSIDITATARAGANIGGLPSKMNIMIVLDTTASMNGGDNSCGKSMTKLDCALLGVQNILSQLNPAYQQVGLVVFPPLTSATNVGAQYCSPSGKLTSANIAKYKDASPKYTIFSINASNTGPQTGYSQVVNNQNQLSPTSNWGQLLGKNGCAGISAIGGVGTFFADAIAQAQSQLIAANPNPATSGIENLMFVLSDGDAGASSSNMPTGKAKNQCQQAVTAATSAKNAGTIVYSLAYGASSGGCSTDAGLSACVAMKNIASSGQTFFADTSSSCSGSISLANISKGFSQGVGQAIKPRLIPDAAICPTCN